MILLDAKTMRNVAIGILLALMGVFQDASLVLAQSRDPDQLDERVQGFETTDSVEDPFQELLNGFETEPSVDSDSALPVDDDIMQGFEDQPIADAPPADMPRQSSWRLDGELSFGATYNVAPDAVSPWRGFSMLRSELDVSLRNKFSDNWRGQIGVRTFYDAVFALRGRGDYTGQVLDTYEDEFELKDTFIQGRLTDELDIKIGRQVVVWGTLDNLRVTDMLNPLDMRVPGLTDIEDLRLPVTMAALDAYAGNWNFSGVLIPEVRFSKLPVFGSDYYPYPLPGPPQDDLNHGLENMQYAASVTGVFSGWDLALYWANIYADTPYVAQVAADHLVRKHARVNMLGSAANLAVGNWLFKAEAAGLTGLRYANTPGADYTRLDMGAGVEYSGFSEATVSLEAANRRLFDYDERLDAAPDELRENEFQWALRLTRDFLHDTLTITVLAATYGIKADDGAFERIEADYDITDAISIRGGLVLYQSGDKGLFSHIDDSDRLFAVVSWNF